MLSPRSLAVVVVFALLPASAVTSTGPQDDPVVGIGGANGGAVDYGIHEGSAESPAVPSKHSSAADGPESALDCDAAIDNPCTSAQHCAWEPALEQPKSEADAQRLSRQSNIEVPATLAEFELQVRVCSVMGVHSDFTRLQWVQKAEPPPDPAMLAAEVRSKMALPAPGVHRSPTPTNRDAATGLPFTYVNLATWYWADSAAWTPKTDSLSLRGVTVTVTATPTSLAYLPGDGAAEVGCDAAPGRAWTEADGNDVPTDVCAYEYRQVTAADPITSRTSVSWAVTWTSNVGRSGQLDPLVVYSDSGPFVVKQIQVVVGRADR